MPSTKSPCSVGSYLIDRLYDLGVRHIFGVPGDFSLKFCKLLENGKKISFIGTTREDTAGFAADGYARRLDQGIGVVLVTHGVGALSTVNPIAGAYAESSPVLVISGAPGLRERMEHPLIHHSFGTRDAQRRIFQNITCKTTVIDDLHTASREMDAVLECIWNLKKPGYIELPRDMIDRVINTDRGLDSFCQYRPSDGESLNEAVTETLERLKKAKSPVLLAGVELHRFNAQVELESLVEKGDFPVAASIMGKSVIDERHLNYLGIYQGGVGSELARKKVEDSDLVLSLGMMFTDINLGMYTAHLDPNRMIRVNQGEVLISHHRYTNIMLKDFLNVLNNRMVPLKKVHTVINKTLQVQVEENNNKYHDKHLEIADIISTLNSEITPDLNVVCDTGDCLFAASELEMPGHSSFFASAYYTTMGFAVPAALGIACAKPGARPLILVGDGAFQMTGTELASFQKLGHHPVVVLINNKGYATERIIMEGTFNDIPEWNYEAICQLIDQGCGCKVDTVFEFQTALEKALADPEQMYVINAEVKDSSQGMQKLATEVSHRMQATLV